MAACSAVQLKFLVVEKKIQQLNYIRSINGDKSV
jgi:hypothetical protein